MGYQYKQTLFYPELPNNSDIMKSLEKTLQLINQGASQVGAQPEHECAGDKRTDSHLGHHSQPHGIH
jgi:hypothetical protein